MIKGRKICEILSLSEIFVVPLHLMMDNKTAGYSLSGVL